MARARALLAVLTPLAVILAGCGSPSGASSATAAPANPLQPSATVYVASGGAPSQILAYSANSTGNPSPSNRITLQNATAEGFIAADPSGNLYIATATDVREYAAGATGAATPTRIFPLGAATLVENPFGLAADALGNLYVSDQLSGRVAVFSASQNGSVAPARAIAGSLTGIVMPGSLALDSGGNLYVANLNPNGVGSVLVFAPNATGDVAPIRVLNIPAFGIAVDAAGNLYAETPSGIGVYPAGAAGNASPTRTISTTNSLTGSLAVDAAGNLYVVDQDIVYGSLLPNPTVMEYAPTASGSAPPAATFTPTAWVPGTLLGAGSIALH